MANVGESGESRTFQKTAVLASTRTRQKRRVSREYSNSLNLPASSHCLKITQNVTMGEGSIGLRVKHVTIIGGWIFLLLDQSNLERNMVQTKYVL